MAAGPTVADVIRAIITVVRAGRPVGKVGMYAQPCPTNVIRAFVTVIRTCRAIGLIVAQTDP